MLQSVLLAMLSEQPNTGYGIARLLRNGLSHLWDARPQHIYYELAKLRARGLVNVRRIALSNRPAKKIYSLSPAGQQQLDLWLAVAPAPHSCKDDLLVRIYCLERMPAQLVTAQVEDRLAHCEGRAAELRLRLEQAQDTDAAGLGEILTLEGALASAEGQAAWCAGVLSRIPPDRSGEP